jgi:hypothetical protein
MAQKSHQSERDEDWAQNGGDDRVGWSVIWFRLHGSEGKNGPDQEFRQKVRPQGLEP